MLLLRIAGRNRWAADRTNADREHVEDAAVDLQVRVGESGLSVFHTEGAEDARELAVRFALTCREDPRHVDYLVFSAETAERLGLIVVPAPREDLEPRLSERHHEVLGLSPDLALRLAADILADTGRLAARVQKADLIPLGKALCESEPDLRTHLKGRWKILLGDPGPTY